MGDRRYRCPTVSTLRAHPAPYWQRALSFRRGSWRRNRARLPLRVQRRPCRRRACNTMRCAFSSLLMVDGCDQGCEQTARCLQPSRPASPSASPAPRPSDAHPIATRPRVKRVFAGRDLQPLIMNLRRARQDANRPHRIGAISIDRCRQAWIRYGRSHPVRVATLSSSHLCDPDIRR